MIIKSDFQDYYDYCLGYGIDKKVVYNRKKEIIEARRAMEEVPPKLKAVLSSCNGWGPDMTLWPIRAYSSGRAVSVVVVGFAGKLMKVILTDTLVKTPVERVTRKGYYPHVNEEWVKELHFTADTLPADITEKKRWRLHNLTYGDVFKAPLTRENDEVFIALGAPVFVAYEDAVIINPKLSDYGFGKHVDGVTAFQEISTYIAGALSSANSLPMVTDDKSLAQAKGFDKHSFRKGPTKRKKQ